MMKPRKPLVQRTPITRKTELKRSQLKPGAPQLKSSGPVKSRKPGRQSAAEKQCRVLLPVRSGGICEIQVPGVCSGRAKLCGHRKRRSQSGKAEKWSPTNVLHDCPECEQYLTDNGSTPQVRSYGWTVHPSVDPAAMPVLRRGVWVWLLEDGSVEPLDFRELAEWVA